MFNSLTGHTKIKRKGEKTMEDVKISVYTMIYMATLGAKYLRDKGILPNEEYILYLKLDKNVENMDNATYTFFSEKLNELVK